MLSLDAADFDGFQEDVSPREADQQKAVNQQGARDPVGEAEEGRGTAGGEAKEGVKEEGVKEEGGKAEEGKTKDGKAGEEAKKEAEVKVEKVPERYFIAKCTNKDALLKSVKTGSWQIQARAPTPPAIPPLSCPSFLVIPPFSPLSPPSCLARPSSSFFSSHSLFLILTTPFTFLSPHEAYPSHVTSSQQSWLMTSGSSC